MDQTRFTNSLHQREPSFGFKKLLSGFTNDMQRKLNVEKA